MEKRLLNRNSHPASYIPIIGKVRNNLNIQHLGNDCEIVAASLSRTLCCLKVAASASRWLWDKEPELEKVSNSSYSLFGQHWVFCFSYNITKLKSLESRDLFITKQWIYETIFS